MARPRRVEFAGALYHITARGDRREALFEDDDDRLAFANVLAEAVERCSRPCKPPACGWSLAWTA